MSPCAAWSEIVAKLAVPHSWEVDASAHSLHESVAAIYSDYKDKVEKPGGSELPTDLELVQLKEVAEKEFSFDLATVDAEYATFPRIVAREGGESADLVSFENAKAYVQSALAKWQSGETFHGHAWVKFDSMRNCAVVLHYREKVSSGTRREFGLLSQRTQKPEEEPRCFERIETRAC